MRFIGNKENLICEIYQIMQSRGIKGNSFFDFFAGTTSVGQFFKMKGYQVFSSDLLYFSYVLQKAYIENNQELTFEKLLNTINTTNHLLFDNNLSKVVNYLNDLPLEEGFISKNYTPEGTQNLEIPRMYFTYENGKTIDTLRIQIERWKTGNLINEYEYFVLLACLIETIPFYSNISGTYAAFLKTWDKRALKKLLLKPIKLILNKKENKVFNQNSVELINQISTDIL